MNPTRWKILVVSFWVFICGMLLWQFINYNQGLDKETVENPKPAHFFYYDTNTGPVTPSKSKVNGPDVKQIAFSVEQGKPTPPYFTCHVTLKNYGNAKAIHVQVWVRPYKGVAIGDGGETLLPGQTANTYLSDDDPISKMGDWVNFPDLAPDESKTMDVTYLKRQDAMPGTNPKPDITFSAEEAKP